MKKVIPAILFLLGVLSGEIGTHNPLFEKWWDISLIGVVSIGLIGMVIYYWADRLGKKN